MHSGRGQDLTSGDFATLDPARTVVLLPVAAIEQHGPHRTLATDALINEAIVAELLAHPPPDVAVLALPPLAVGDSLEHVCFAGTLSIATETLGAAWMDLGRSVARAGLRKLVIFNSHGGQVPLVDLVARRLRAELKMLVARASYFRFGTPPGLFEQDELAFGLHGGEVETALMLHLRPDLVRQEHLQEFHGLPAQMADDHDVLGTENPVGIGWMSQDLHREGVCGNAARADAARGAQLLAHLVDVLARLVRNLGAADLALLR